MKIFRFLIISFLCMVAIEIAARLYGFGEPPLAVSHPSIEYYMVPDRVYERFGNRIEINSYGMRSEQFNAEKQENEKRVIFYGDSIVYGVHHIDQSETIAARVKSLLGRQHPEKSIVVASAAASSWGPENILAYIKEFGTFNGDMGYLVVSSHDLADVVIHDERLFPYRLSKPFGAFHDVVLAVWSRYQRQAATGSTLSPDERRTVCVSAYKEIVGKLKMDHEKVILVFHPTKAELLSGGGGEEREFYRALAENNSINFIDMSKAYLDANEKDISIYHDNIHLSVEGAMVFSDYLMSDMEGN